MGKRLYIVVRVLQPAALDDSDDEEAEEDVPQIKRQLAPQVRADVARFLRVVVVVLLAVDAEASLLVDVGPPHGNGNGKHGYVHHDQIGNLDGGVQFGDVDDGEARRACRRRLEPAVEDADAAREGGDDRVVELGSDDVSESFVDDAIRRDETDYIRRE